MSPGTSIVASGTSSQEALPTSTLALTSQKLQGARWPRPLKLGSTQTDYTSWAADGGLIVMGSVASLVLIGNIPFLGYFEGQLQLILSTGVFALVGTGIDVSMGQASAYGTQRSYAKSICSAVGLALATWTMYAWMLLVLLLKPGMNMFAPETTNHHLLEQEGRSAAVVRLMQATRILTSFMVLIIGGLELGWRVTSLRHIDTGSQLLLSSAGFQAAFSVLFLIPLVYQLGLEYAILGIAPARQHWYAVLALFLGTLLCIGRAATSLAIEAFSESPLGRLILALTLLSFYATSALLTSIKLQQRSTALICSSNCTHETDKSKAKWAGKVPSGRAKRDTPNFIGTLSALDYAPAVPGTAEGVRTSQTRLSHFFSGSSHAETMATIQTHQLSEMEPSLRREGGSLRPTFQIPPRVSSSIELTRASETGPRRPASPAGVPLSILGVDSPRPQETDEDGHKDDSASVVLTAARPSAPSPAFSMPDMDANAGGLYREEQAPNIEQDAQFGAHHRQHSGNSNKTHLTVTSFFNASSSPPMPTLPAASRAPAANDPAYPFRTSLELSGTHRRRSTSRPFVPSRLRQSFFGLEDGEPGEAGEAGEDADDEQQVLAEKEPRVSELRSHAGRRCVSACEPTREPFEVQSSRMVKEV